LWGFSFTELSGLLAHSKGAFGTLEVVLIEEQPCIITVNSQFVRRPHPMLRFSRFAVPTALLAALCIAAPLKAQNVDTSSLTMEDVINGKGIPQSLRVKDLNGNYRRVRYADVMMMGGRGANRDLSIYFTKGQSVRFGTVDYLIAYRPEAEIDPNWMKHGPGTVVITKLRPVDKLLLSLLSTQGLYAGSFNDIRPFDPELDMETPADRNQAVQQVLQQLGKGILQWKHNRNQERLPNLPQWGKRVTDALRRHCYPVVHDKRLWEHPSTSEAFGLNAALANRRLPDITNRAALYMVYEFTPATDGTRAVLFADGHVERVDAARWARLQKTAIQTRTPSKKAKARTSTTDVVGGGGQRRR
jgi:prepilin-type processing-associated H-X9-DG protein